MAKKRDQRGQIPRMKDLSIAEQDELIQRWRLRKDLRTLHPEIVEVMMRWVIDSVDIDQFVAASHEAHFMRNPSTDLFMRMLANGYSEDEIQIILEQGEPPSNWMNSETLASVIWRIEHMLNYFKGHPSGSFEQAIRMYQVLGITARKLFIQQYGYPPEQSAIPRVRITGEDKDLKKLQPTDHQPPLMT